MPADSVRLQLPLDSLLALPGGAVYETASGRAHARAYVAKPDGGTRVVYVDAWCDSLARLVAWYESRELTSGGTARAESKQTQDTVQTAKEQPPDGIGRKVLEFIAGIIAGAVITFIIRKRQ